MTYVSAVVVDGDERTRPNEGGWWVKAETPKTKESTSRVVVRIMMMNGVRCNKIGYSVCQHHMNPWPFPREGNFSKPNQPVHRSRPNQKRNDVGALDNNE